MPSPGYLFVKGPSDDYVLQAIGFGMVQQGQPGGPRIYSHAFRWLDLKPGIALPSQEVDVVLRRGATVTGQVVGPDGQPVRDAWIFSRSVLDPPSRGAWGVWSELPWPRCLGGRFGVRGLDPDSEVPVYVLDAEEQAWAARRQPLGQSSPAAAPKSPSGSNPAAAAKSAVCRPGRQAGRRASRRRDVSHHGRLARSTSQSRERGQAGFIAADETDLKPG